MEESDSLNYREATTSGNLQVYKILKQKKMMDITDPNSYLFLPNGTSPDLDLITGQKSVLDYTNSTISTRRSNGGDDPMKSYRSSSDRDGGLRSASSSSNRKSPAKSALQQESFLSNMDDSVSIARRAKVAEFENSTIQKQRNELQLMIGELKKRDQELNDMVMSHQKQLLAWERDRKRILTLEEKCSVLEKEIMLKKDEIRQLHGQIKLLQATEVDRTTALKNAQEELGNVAEEQTRMSMAIHDYKRQIAETTEQHSLASLEITDLEEKNRNLTSTIMDLNSTIGQMDAREQELISVLKLKDKDLSESANRIAELSAKLKKLETSNEQSKRVESDSKRSASEWKNKYNQVWKELDHMKREYRKLQQENESSASVLSSQKQELASLRKENIITSEREKRKEQMLELQQSKQDRSELEMNNLRSLCEKQQRDLSVLTQSLQNTKEIVDKQQARLLHHRKIDFEASYTSCNSDVVDYTRRSRYGSPRRSASPARSPVRNTTNSLQRRSTSPTSRSYSPSRFRSAASPTRSTAATSSLSSVSTSSRQRSPSPTRLMSRSSDIRYHSPTRYSTSYTPNRGISTPSAADNQKSPDYSYNSHRSLYVNKYDKEQPMKTTRYSNDLDRKEDEEFLDDYPIRHFSSKTLVHLEDLNHIENKYGGVPSSNSNFNVQSHGGTEHSDRKRDFTRSAEDIMNRYYPAVEPHFLSKKEISDSDMESALVIGGNGDDITDVKRNLIEGVGCENELVTKATTVNTDNEVRNEQATDPKNDGENFESGNGGLHQSGGFETDCMEPNNEQTAQPADETPKIQTENDEEGTRKDEDYLEVASLHSSKAESVPTLKAESDKSDDEVIVSYSGANSDEEEDCENSPPVDQQKVLENPTNENQMTEDGNRREVESIMWLKVEGAAGDSFKFKAGSVQYSSRAESVNSYEADFQSEDEQSSSAAAGVGGGKGSDTDGGGKATPISKDPDSDAIEDMFSSQKQQKSGSKTPVDSDRERSTSAEHKSGSAKTLDINGMD